MRNQARIKKLHGLLFSEALKNRFESLTIALAIIGFLIHLVLIYLNMAGWISLGPTTGQLFIDPIAAIYTPFSFILIFEVYLLLYYLPESFSTSVGKQFEIITLIEIRNIFKDISRLDLTPGWFEHPPNVVFTVDLVGFVLLFYLMYWFYRLKNQKPKEPKPPGTDRFITYKQLIASVAFFIFAGLSIYSLGKYAFEVNQFSAGVIQEMSDINKIFFGEFFSALIMVDVLILMISFRFTEQYSQLIRNSGYVISTILIRLSFSSTEILNMILVVVGVMFGVILLKIYNLIRREEMNLG